MQFSKMKLIQCGALTLILGVLSLPTSAAILQLDGNVTSCTGGACSFVPPTAPFELGMIVPDGPTGPLAPTFGDVSTNTPGGNFQGYNTQSGFFPLVRPVGFINTLGPIVFEPTASTLEIGADNLPSAGSVTFDIFDFSNIFNGTATIDWEGNWTSSGTVTFGISSQPFDSTGTGAWSVVPVPAAVWLFGSGLLGLVGVARRRAV